VSLTPPAVDGKDREARTRRLVLGKIGTLTPDEARQLAGDVLSTVAKGSDPSADRHAVRRAITIFELCDLYLAAAKARIKASTYASDVSRIETHVKPLERHDCRWDFEPECLRSFDVDNEFKFCRHQNRQVAGLLP
jgi:hypothetical protein